MTLLIGDIHGDLEFYLETIRGKESSLQLGDFGVGFLPIRKVLELDELYPEHKFIRGNHDNPELSEELLRFVPSGIDENTGYFMVNGAWSIDWAIRTPGVNWWDREQHSTQELDSLVDEYSFYKPDTVITHDCPSLVAYHMFLKGRETSQYLTRTGEKLQRMFELHVPKRWYFGHWHQTKMMVLEGCEFNCLGINNTLEIG